MSLRSPSTKRVLREPTPRDLLLNERFNLKLTLRAKVCPKSYVFTGSFVEKLRVDDRLVRSVYRVIEEYLKRPSIDVELQKLVSEVDFKLKSSIKLGPSRVLPRYDAKIVIPASAIKGAIRSRIEYKLSPEVSCYSVEQQKLKPMKFYERHLKFWGADVIKSRGSCNFAEDGKVCVVCDLFGSPSLASRIYFSDLEMTSGSVIRLQDLNVEVVAPASEFKSTVSIVNCDFLDLGLLFLGLELYSGSPILLCAYKYRYNPHAGGSKYKGQFIFGTLRFHLEAFSEVLTNKLADLLRKKLDTIKEGREVSKGDLIKVAKLELERQLKDHVFFDRGVMKIEC